MRHRILNASILVLLLVVTAGAAAEPVRLLAFEGATECRCTADLDGQLPLRLEEAAEHLGIETELETVPRAELFSRLGVLLAEGNPPDLVWVPQDRIGDLALTEAFLPLDEFVDHRPYLVEGLDDETLQGFVHRRLLYALPLDREGELSGIGQAVTLASAERGRTDLAIELACFLKERLPPRPVTDLVASVSLDRDELVEREEALIITEVLNAGDFPSEPVPLQILVDGDAVTEFPVESLEPGQQTSVEIAVELPGPGEHIFSANLDTAGLFEEANKQNDFADIGQLVKTLYGGGGPSAPPVIGSPFTLHGAAFHNRVDLGRHVKVAFDGTNFLVAWFIDEPLFTKTGKRRIVGTRVSPTGTILDPLTIAITTSKDRYQSFDLAFDGQRYLVVWERDLGVHGAKTLPNPFSRVEAVRVSKGGVVLDSSPILIEGEPCSGCPVNWSAWQYTAPQVESTSAGFLVVYRRRLAGGTQFEDRIVGRFVNGSGVVQAGRKLLVTLNPGLQPVYGQSMAFHKSRGEGCLLFDAYDYNGPSMRQKVVAVWLKLQGSSLSASPAKTVFSTSTYGGLRLDRPEVAAGANGTYYGAFESNTGKLCSWPDIHGVLLGTFASRSVSPKGGVVKGTAEMRPALDYDGKNYAMVFSHGIGCVPVPGLARVTPGGVAGSRSTPFKNAGGVNDLDVAFGAGKGLVVYTREVSGQNHPSTYKYKIEAFFIKVTP